MKKIVLASASPRRKELLALTGLKFIVAPGDYQEVIDPSLSPAEIAVSLSMEKPGRLPAAMRTPS